MQEQTYKRESEIAKMFREEIREKKVIGHSASKKVRSNGRRVTFPFEMLKGKEKKEYCGNGAVKTYFLSEDELKLYRGEVETMATKQTTDGKLGITWAEIKKQPEKEQKKTLESLIREHRVADLAKKLGITDRTIHYRKKQLGMVSSEHTGGKKDSVQSSEAARNHFERASLKITCKGNVIRSHIETLLSDIDLEGDYSLVISLTRKNKP